VAGIPVLLMDADQPRMQTTNADGTFRMEGLAGGRTLRITVASPNAAFVPDMFEVTLPPDRTDVDLGVFKLVRGTMDSTRPGDGGLGLLTEVKARQPQIVQVFDQTPASEASLKKGDVIRTIDGHEVAGVGEGGLRQLLNGPGTAVDLGVVSGQQPRTVHLVRRASAKPSPPQTRPQTSQAPVQMPR
jgi:S1-C subfamily serine protease